MPTRNNHINPRNHPTYYICIAKQISIRYHQRHDSCHDNHGSKPHQVDGFHCRLMAPVFGVAGSTWPSSTARCKLHKDNAFTRRYIAETHFIAIDLCDFRSGK